VLSISKGSEWEKWKREREMRRNDDETLDTLYASLDRLLAPSNYSLDR